VTSESADLTYHPVLADASAFLAKASADRFLLVGTGLDDGQGLPDGFEAVEHCRQLSGDCSLPVGNYRFAGPEGIAVMLITKGESAGPPTLADRTETRSNSLEQAEAWFEHLWAEAALIPEPSFQMNDLVNMVVDGREAQVRNRRFEDGAWRYAVRCDGRTRIVDEAAVSVADIDDDPHEWIQRPVCAARQIAATLTRAKLIEHLTDMVYSFRATRTIYRPYQFRPVIKLLRTGRHRLLIADEVGLGKTIEAGLIWTEFDARGQADRVLVVCPSMLVAKWRAEMDERFGYEVTELDSDGLERVLTQMESDRLPPRFRAVCSLERLRRWEGLERLNDLAPRFDLIIVDEAHSFRNLGTMSHALGALLSDWSDALVFLSATPLNLGNADLFNLLQLLEPGEFDDLHALKSRLEPNAVLTRISTSLLDAGVDNSRRLSWLMSVHGLTFGPAVTQRREFTQLESLLGADALDHQDIAEAKRLVAELHTLSSAINRTRKAEIDEEPTIREAHSIPVKPTEVERDFYQAVHEWQAERARRKGMALGFIGQMPLRLAGSCLPAMRDKVLDEASAWADVLADPDDHEESSELDGVDDLDKPPPDVVAAARALGDVDTKFDEFVGRLAEVVEQGRKVLIFTFSRPTLAYLERRLTGRFRVASLHGGVPSRARQGVIAEFRAGEFDLMLASRVASEGLDFEFCGAVINYDLPWNPMEVEQRIGRIDRFGQREEVIYVMNFHTPGTIESDIIERVHERIGVFSESIGEMEPILQSQLAGLQKVIYDFDLSDGQRARKIDQILAAVETKAQIRTEVEDAADYLNVLDNTEVDGFEDEVIKNGRYVGQPELVWLLEDWAASAPGATCELSEDRLWLRFRGNATLEEHLLGVQAAGERSASEIAVLSADLRNEAEIHLCLDQETARRRGADLLSANHPLVLAALRAPSTARCRFGSVSMAMSDIDPGFYLVIVGVAHWSGVRSATEFWTAAADSSGYASGERPGDLVLAALAEARLAPASTQTPSWSARALRECQRQLDRRLDDEGRRRDEENRALASARRISLAETHNRKLAQIRVRIDTLRREGKPATIPLFESQIRNQEHLYRKAEQDLEDLSIGSMDLEYVAVCVVEVV